MNYSSTENIIITSLQRNLNFLLKNGLCGSDPLLYNQLPLNKISKRLPTPISALIRKAEKYTLNKNPRLLFTLIKYHGYDKDVNVYGLALLVQALLLMDEMDFHTNNLIILIEEIINENLIKYSSLEMGVGNPGFNNIIYLPGTAEALLMYLKLFKKFNNEKYLKNADSLVRGVIGKIKYNETTSGGFFSYGSDGPHYCVLNANALMLDALSNYQTITGNEKLEETISKTYQHIKTGLNFRYIPYSLNNLSNSTYDVYHTGFYLRSLSSIASKFNDKDCLENIYNSADNMLNDFISKDGLIYTHRGRPTQSDIHGLAEYIRTLSFFSENSVSLDIVNKNIKFMDNYVGSYFYQRGLFEINIYMPRWGHFPMMLALSELLRLIKKINIK
jgi:hypothetical protein